MHPISKLAAATIVAVVAASAGLSGLGGAGAASSSGPKRVGPDVFVTGTLADFDDRPLKRAHASAAILATDDGGSGIARIEVSVDGRLAASHPFHCHGSCPASGRLGFDYERRHFGSGHHKVRITAVDGAGHAAHRTISIEPPPDVGSQGAPKAEPAFYITAGNANDLRHQAADDAARFARRQGPGHALLVLDFGAARHAAPRYGAALRSGTFFTDQQIGSALDAAARSYHDHYRRGSVTIVYANSNAYLARPGPGFQAMTKKTAREAGLQQARTARHVHLYAHESAAPGGDIEPGYDIVASPDVPLALVAGASAGAGPYFDLGTAPCTGNDCTHGWVVSDICAVTTGAGRLPVPEIYFGPPIDQSAQWSAVVKKCGIKGFAGVSASPLGDFTPGQSWQLLGRSSGRHVDPAIVVFPR